VYSVTTENKDTTNAYFMPVKLFATAAGPLKEYNSLRSDESTLELIRAEDIFWAFVVNFDLINNKNSTVVKMGTCNETVLCHVEVKYYTLQIFIVERNLSIKLKTHSFPDTCLYKCFSLSWCEELTLSSMSKHFRYTLYKDFVWSLKSDNIPTQH
jgi:hypothetical protein